MWDGDGRLLLDARREGCVTSIRNYIDLGFARGLREGVAQLGVGGPVLQAFFEHIDSTLDHLEERAIVGTPQDCSSEIIRTFNSAFDAVGAAPGDYYPEALRKEIDAVNARICDTVNNGVYKSGFAMTQEAYDAAVLPLFETLDWLEDRVAGKHYIVGNTLTEADWRLFTTLVRFDAVYHGHFKCNLRRLIDYPNLWAYTKRLYALPGIKDTVFLDHIKHHYYASHAAINPTRVVPVGPVLSFDGGRNNKGIGVGQGDGELAGPRPDPAETPPSSVGASVRMRSTRNIRSSRRAVQ